MSSPARFNMTRLRLDLAEANMQRAALVSSLRELVPIVSAYATTHPSDAPTAESLRIARDLLAKVQS